MRRFNRRQFMAQAGAITSGMRLGLANGASSYSYDFPDMLLAHLTGKLNAMAAQWDEKRSKILTKNDLEIRNRFVRDRFREMVHGFPERSALNPVVVRVHERDGYRVENVMFQSRPNFWVTGNLSGKGLARC